MDDIFLNTPVWYTVIAEISACMLYVILIGQPLRTVKKIAALGGVLCVHLLYFMASDFIYARVANFFMVGTLAVMYLYFVVGCKLNFLKRIYYLIRAFLLAEFLASFGWLVYLFLLRRMALTRVQEALLLIAGYGLILLGLWWLERKTSLENEHIRISLPGLLGCLLIGVCAYISSGLVVDSASAELAGDYGMALFAVRTLLDFAGVIMLYAHNMQLFNMQVNQQNYAIHTILRQQKQQYQFSKECIDMVNRKYHDLKYQVNGLPDRQNEAASSQYMAEVSDQMELFDRRIDCGHQVLNIILTEENMQCAQKEINLTAMVDGAALSFLPAEDLCAIFGNAIDNAIECVEKLPDPAQRLIHVSVHRVHDFVILLFENYYKGTLEMSNGLPLTTKENKNYHGYGIKSIQYVVQSHGGQMSIVQENDWFKLKIIFCTS